jgi:hypothetical protein
MEMAEQLDPSGRQHVLNLIRDLDLRVAEGGDGCRVNLGVVTMTELRAILEFIDRILHD